MKLKSVVCHATLKLRINFGESGHQRPSAGSWISDCSWLPIKLFCIPMVPVHIRPCYSLVFDVFHKQSWSKYRQLISHFSLNSSFTVKLHCLYLHFQQG